MAAFTPEVYAIIREGCQRSAEAVVPTVYDLAQPKAVVDVGGGEGWWGRAFFDLGSSVMVADESFDVWRFEVEAGPERHRIDFMPVELRSAAWASRLAAERASIARIHGGPDSFDLALCLEVAEHLPPEFADQLVAGVCSLAPVVLFSAAIPGQTGHGHVNCQWPAYWVERFARQGFEVSGELRWRIWNDERVEPWYRQNILVAACRDHVDPDVWNYLGNELFGPEAFDDPIPVVHPSIWSWKL